MSTLPLSIKSVSSFVSLYKFTSRFKMSIHVYGAKIATKCDRFVIGGKIYTFHRANVFTQRGNKGQTKRRISECSEIRRRTQNNHLLPKKVTDIHN